MPNYSCRGCGDWLSNANIEENRFLVEYEFDGFYGETTIQVYVCEDCKEEDENVVEVLKEYKIDDEG